MKVLIVIDETPFFHPDYLDRIVQKLIKKNPNVDISVGIVIKIPKTNDISIPIKKYFYLFNIIQILKLILIFLFRKSLNKLFPEGRNNKNYSVEGVCLKNKIKYFKIKENINREIYINKIKSFMPNIVLSSNSLYFQQEILSLRNIIFLNRHTSLLPAYGGVWPVLQAIKNEEKFIGVTIHIMNNKIDQGNIIVQQSYEISKKSLYKIYSDTFKISIDLSLIAIDLVQNGNLKFVKNKLKYSYNKMPSKNDIKKFLSVGGKLI